MELPKFLLADNTSHPDKVYVVHTQYPAFVLDMTTDKIYWQEEFDDAEIKEINLITDQLIKQAYLFYDGEIELLE